MFDKLDIDFVEFGMCRSAEFKMGEPFFQLSGDFDIKFIELLKCAAPHFELFGVGFVPDFPIFNIEIKTVPQPLRVMADDIGTDVDPLIHIGGRIDFVLSYGMVY